MNLKSIIKNKKGSINGIGIILFFFAILTILAIGFMTAMVWSAIDFASDTVTPIMTDLGVVGDTNLSQAAEYGFGTANVVVQSFPWVAGFGYVMSLIFILTFVFLIGYNPHPAFIGLFFVLMMLMIFGAVIMSNMYQDIYTGTDEISTRLQEQTLLSFMILHSPAILAMIAIVGGILMFARMSSNDGTGGVGI